MIDWLLAETSTRRAYCIAVVFVKILEKGMRLGRFRFLAGLMYCLLFCGSLPAVPPSAKEAVNYELVAEDSSILPERPFWLALSAELAPGFQTYWKNAGDAGMSTSVTWDLPPGFELIDVAWPSPAQFDKEGMVSFGYTQNFALLAEIRPPKNLDPERSYKFSACVQWVACDDRHCIPGDSQITIDLPASKIAPFKDVRSSSLFQQARKQIPAAGWPASAVKNGHAFELTLAPPQGKLSDMQEAAFFPDEQGVVDPLQTLCFSQKKEGGYLVSLPAVQQEASLQTLRGVLVLKDSRGGSQAIAINTPLSGAPKQALALADKVSLAGHEFDMGLGLAIIMAFFGGMILNLMPCVLPVISLKVLSFVQIAGQTRSTTLRHGIAFSAGVISSFWVLAGLLLALQAYGHAVGWGFQLQEPLFVALLAAILFVFGLSLFGVFEFGHMFASWAGQRGVKAKHRSHGLTGSFLNGVLATAVATPCTGPFLGAAIGFAVTLSPLYSMLVFTSLGLGMAFPYLMLAAFPSLMRWLPKPGAWMVMFKQLMGFLILATILWLVWVFGAQTGNRGMFLLLAGLFVLSFGCWVYGQWSHPIKPRRTRLAGGLCALFILLVGAYLVVASAQVTPEGAVQTAFYADDIKTWHSFSKETVDQLRAAGNPVFVDFTAKWCVICQTNFAVLSMANVTKKFDELGVYRFKADWTRPDPVITEELRKYGRNGVPLYLLYAPGSDKPVILPQVLTPDTVVSYLNEMEIKPNPEARAR